MTNKIETIKYDVNINRGALLKKLNIDIDDTDSIELIDSFIQEAKAIGSPKVMFKKSQINSIKGGIVTIDDVEFNSTIMSNNLKDSKTVIVYIVTCGTELDEWAENKTDFVEQFWGKALCEHVLGNAFIEFRKYSETVLASPKPISIMNPGSLEDWPITEQKKLFALLGDPKRDIGVFLSDSYLMYPIKSTSGIIFESDKDFVNCSCCPKPTCPNRRAPYDSHFAEEIQTA